MDGIQFGPDGTYTIEQDPEALLPFAVQWYEFLRGSDKYWSRRTFVRPGETCTPSKAALNGHRYRASLGGTTGINEPAWTTEDADQVVDGGVTWLEVGAEDTIASSTWAGGGLTTSNDIVDATGCVATVTLAGLTAGQRYTVTNSIISVQGKKQDQSFDVIAKEI